MIEYWFKARVYLTDRFRSKYFIDEKCIGDSYIIAEKEKVKIFQSAY